MRSLIIKATLALCAAAGIYQYSQYRDTGINPLDKLKTLKAPSLSLPATKQTVYKWVDAQGVTQYSETPPEDVQAQTLEISPDTNIVESVKPIKRKPDKNATPASAPASPQRNVYSPNAINDVMDKAKNVQKLMDERMQKQAEALDKL